MNKKKKRSNFFDFCKISCFLNEFHLKIHQKIVIFGPKNDEKGQEFLIKNR